MSTLKVSLGIFVVLVALLAATAPWVVLAATKNLNAQAGGCPAGANWSSASCWTPSGAPVTGDDVLIDNSQGAAGAQCLTNYDLSATVQLHSITLNSCTGAGDIFTLTGGPIVLQSGGVITNTF